MRLTKKGKKCLAFLSLIIIMSVFAISQINAFANRAETAEYFSYIVQPNDSLWSIAEEFSGEGDDIRQKIHEIKKMNQLKGSSIQVGTRLMIAYE